jgi:hypothetical protein
MNDQETTSTARRKAYDKKDTTFEEHQKTIDEVLKASRTLEKSYFEYRKACDLCEKVYLPHYRRIFPNSPWNGHSILY